MSEAPAKVDLPRGAVKQHPFRRAVLRGLAIAMPPLLTIVVFIWVGTTIDAYLLAPLESFATNVCVQASWDVLDEVPPGVAVQTIHGQAKFVYDRKVYVQLESGKWIPDTVYDYVNQHSAKFNLKTATAKEVYERFVKGKYLQRYKTVPIFLLLFVLLLYLLGRFLAAGVGSIAWNFFEQLIRRLPIIRTVYSATKQVTDFVFKEQDVEFTRVVAVQYPRKGVWSMGFVTGESFLDIRSAANEPVLSVLMPTSPMPATGFTITVPKSETVDLDITVEQAIQFCVSCGVVVPAHQQYDSRELAQKITAAIHRNDGKDQQPGGADSLPASSAQPSAGDG